MTTFRMSKYADEGGILQNVGDAEFLQRKIHPDDVFDFTGIRSATPAFLDALFLDAKSPALAESFRGVEGPLSDALRKWLTPEPEPELAPTAPAVVTWKRPQSHDEEEKYTPTRLAQRLRRQLRRYIESAYPLSDATLIKSRRQLLETAEHGKLLAQDPFVETTPRYRVFRGTYGDLGLPAATGALFTRLSQARTDHDADRTLLFPSIYDHQAKAFQAFLGEGRDLVVATGTGSGKTECFLLPLLARLYEEASGRPKSFERRAIRGLILYPMNALVNDQLSRLRLLLGSAAVMQEFRGLGPGRRHPLFGMYTSRTPYAGPRDGSKDGARVEPLLRKYLEMPEALRAELKKLGRFPAKDLEAFLAADKAEKAAYKTGKKKGQSYTKHKWDERLRTGPDDRELFTRHEMVRDPETGQGGAPDVLVTNYSMLEYMLARPFERPMFDETRAWLEQPGSRLLLVLDEAHMYRGAKGAEVAFLLRRLLSRLGVIDKPEKIAVICTSASLGGGDAKETARRFAADLTGKSPDGFEVVFGERERPSPVAPGDAALADVLARVPLTALTGDLGPEALVDAVAPVLAHLGDTDPCPSPGEIPRRLLRALSGRPWVNQVIAATSEQARPLAELSDVVFPGSAARRKATEVLLSLGTLARRSPEDASLLPTRIHLMFRGIAGIYACLDPHCSGRQERPGEEAPLGKLFAAPRALCDACGARVLELASCRNCGGAYLRAGVENGKLDSARFLWGEAAGDLDTIEILPTRPRNEEGVEEAAIHLTTGHLVSPADASHARVRRIWLPRDRETGRRLGSFARCPLCQPPGLPLNVLRKAFITDLQTRGEQPFTALIEAQFAEQPPQKRDDTLPNRGRKVLVFSDGRQRAARLAPALEMSHSRDAFRQVLLLAAGELAKIGRPPGIASIFPALLKVCTERSIDPFPAADETEFHDELRRAKEHSLETLLHHSAQNILQPTLSYAKSLFAELTDRYFSLQAMGLATVEEEPAVDYIFDDFPDVGFSHDEVRRMFRAWIRVQLERRCFLPPGASLSQLGDPWERPEGIRLDAKNDLVPIRFAEWLNETIGEEGARKVTAWFVTLARSKGFLLLLNDAYYLQPKLLILRPRIHERWSRCTSCSRLDVHVVRDRCTECRGKMVAADDELYLDARYGFYRDQVERALQGDSVEPFGLTTAEHTAQLSSLNDDDAFSTTEKYELRFQDVRVEGEPPIDVLSCTTTMEVGIDIGALTGVALRNVPPHVANYQQRAGRAGRRGRTIASVITYAHGGSHDAWYYEHPEKIISGDVRPPVVYVENQKVLERHVNAFLVQRFFHENVAPGGRSYQLFASLGTVKDFLNPSEPCSLARLVVWLRENRERLQNELVAWIPTYSHGFEKSTRAERAVGGAIDRLIERLHRDLPVELAAQVSELDEAGRAALDLQLDEQLLQTLIDRAILPRYAFPTDTVSFWVPEPRRPGAKAWKRRFDYSPQRDLQIALSEYAPGRTLTIDKFRFESAALYSPYPPGVRDVLARARAYTACKSCGFVTLDRATRAQPACPVCREAQLATLDFVRPEGFAPDVNKEREIDRGGAITYAGMSTPAKIEVQSVREWEKDLYGGRLRLLSRAETLVVVNKGVGDRGFYICPSCGSAEPVFGPGFTTPRLVGKDGHPKVHKHPTEEGGQCTGSAVGPFYLGHQFPTDVLLLRVVLAPPMKCAVDTKHSGRAGAMALTSLVEALCLAASRTLQIDEGELAGNWNPVPGEVTREADLYLYDLLPGGAGYTHQVRRFIETVLFDARELLAGCDCATSCHRCLRHYGNQMLHGSLDRHLGLALLEYVLEGIEPSVTAEEAAVAIRPLCDLLRLRGIQFETGATETAPVPLRVRISGDWVWVDVHHPLVDYEVIGARVLDEAQGHMVPVVALDTFKLLNDLPRACRDLGVEKG
ncbi:DEAD/DEAH box helicase [Polyangium sp. 6x1]|uniref:DEAD/DEAH box helicase n=1 Tax=Polyangium sp. 6x1 TaxID=3042689 RepID=UPI0024826281|nr:DEAD/DEAH box helicase [Polyangium sp. 6x1]MDI1442404.1 DEAD/DEAH box helicase [Polyangium sp. 6x1]